MGEKMKMNIKDLGEVSASERTFHIISMAFYWVSEYFLIENKLDLSEDYARISHAIYEGLSSVGYYRLSEI